MAIWREVLSRLDHRDVWGPGGLFPLAEFRSVAGGYRARCPNPAHPDRHPSFSMPRGRPFGKCFPCGYTRTWINFVMEQQGASPSTRGGEPFWRALGVLAERAGMTLPERRPPGATPAPPVDPAARARAAAAEYLRQALRGGSPVAQRVRSYLRARGVAERHLPLFPVGALDSTAGLRHALKLASLPARAIAGTGLFDRYADTHTLIFVYGDGREVTGFKRRVPDRSVKEVKNATGFGGHLEARSFFGLECADEAIAASGRAILVEGEFDALAIQAALLEAKGATAECVALGGTSKPTVEKFHTLKRLGAEVVYLAFDADAAGQRATAQALPMAWAEGLDALVLPMPAGVKDPDEALAALGLERVLTDVFTLDRALPGAEWLAGWLERQAEASPESRLTLRRRAIELALAMPPAEATRFLAVLAPRLGEPPEGLQRTLAEARDAARDADLRTELTAWARDFQQRLGQGPVEAALAEARARLDVLERTARAG